MINLVVTNDKGEERPSLVCNSSPCGTIATPPSNGSHLSFQIFRVGEREGLRANWVSGNFSVWIVHVRNASGGRGPRWVRTHPGWR